MPEGHVLAGAARVWDQTKGELEEKEGDGADLRDGTAVPPDEMKKVAKFLQAAVTKFGASASVEDRKEILQPVADEVIKAFTVAIGTLLSIRRGAGTCLRAELRDVASGLASAVETLGASVGTDAMSVNAGKVLDRVKHFERIPTHNRAAIRRRLLASLAQLRDANREMQETLKSADGGGGGLNELAGSDDDSLGDGDEELEPYERRLAEAACAAIAAFEELVAQVSRACMPTPGGASPGASGPPVDPGSGAIPIPVLEATFNHATTAANAVDSLANASVGGIDVPACEAALVELRASCDGLAGTFETPPLAVDSVREKLDEVKAALDAAAAEIT